MKLRCVLLWLLFAAAPALAEGPDGYEKFYDEPTAVNMGGRPVTADIALYADQQSDDLQIALVTDVTAFIEETERDLERWIAARQQRCGERWAAGEPLIAFPSGAIRFSLALEYEYWNCGWNGRGEPRRLARETGEINVTLAADIEAGKLQARLVALSIDEQTGVNQFLPLQFVARRIVEGEIKTLNENPKFYRAPQPFHREGFVYESIDADDSDDRVVITARYSANANAGALERIAAGLREDGIVSER